MIDIKTVTASTNERDAIKKSQIKQKQAWMPPHVKLERLSETQGGFVPVAEGVTPNTGPS